MESKGGDGANAVIEGGPGRRKGINQRGKQVLILKEQLSSFVELGGQVGSWVLVAFVYP